MIARPFLTSATNLIKETDMDHKIKALLFPKEHGSWALTFEPLTLALLIAPSWAGLVLFFGAAFAFFAHPSAKILLASKFKNKMAWLVFLGFGIPAVILLVLFIRLTGWPIYLPLVLALSLMSLYLLLEAFGLGRKLFTELMASLAIGLIALSLVSAGNFDWNKGLSFLALLYSRTVMATIYIHYRLLVLKNRLQSVWLHNVLHGLDFLIIAFLWYRHLIPALGMLAVLILTIRAIRGVSPGKVKIPVRKLGFQEVYFGLMFLGLVLLGYWLGI